MFRIPKAALLACAVFSVVGCADVSKRVVANRSYDAYGKKWTYVETIHDITEWGLNSPHGILGKIERTKQTAELISGDEVIHVEESIYTLQKGGVYRKISCCNSVGAMVQVNYFDSKLFVNLRRPISKITDCFVDSKFKRDSAGLDREARFFGEFNPKTYRFEIQHAVVVPIWYDDIVKKYGNNPRLDEVAEYYYSKRTTFLCDS